MNKRNNCCAKQIASKASEFACLLTLFLLSACVSDSVMVRSYDDAPGSWILHNVNVLDVESGDIDIGQTLHVENGTILRIEQADKSENAASNSVDGTGLHVIPGLIDSHVHLTSSADLEQFVKNGVTGVQNMWGQEGWITAFGVANTLELIDQVKQDKFGPMIWSAGPVLEGKEKTIPFMKSLPTPELVREEITRQHQLGYDFVKPYDNLSPEVFIAAMEMATELELPAKGHVPYSVSLETAIDQGLSQFEHLVGWLDPDAATLLVAEPDRSRVLAKMKTAGVVACPSLIVYRRIVPADQADSFSQLPGTDSLGALQRFMQWMGARSMRANVTTDLETYPARIKSLQDESLMTLYRNGVTIVAGTDSGNPYVYPGYSLHEEMRMMVDAGIPLIDVIRSATINAARAIGDETRGVLAPGAVADFVVLSINPLESVLDSGDIVGVSLRGRYLPLRH